MTTSETYFHLILRGERTINDVPTRVRGDVIKRLELSGFSNLTVSDGKGAESRPVVK